jgi:hypothetical protein
MKFLFCFLLIFMSFACISQNYHLFNLCITEKLDSLFSRDIDTIAVFEEQFRGRTGLNLNSIKKCSCFNNIGRHSISIAWQKGGRIYIINLSNCKEGKPKENDKFNFFEFFFQYEDKISNESFLYNTTITAYINYKVQILIKDTFGVKERFYFETNSNYFIYSKKNQTGDSLVSKYNKSLHKFKLLSKEFWKELGLFVE